MLLMRLIDPEELPHSAWKIEKLGLICAALYNCARNWTYFCNDLPRHLTVSVMVATFPTKLISGV